MDAEILHRIQFGFNLTFHYIYPPLSIGLSLAIIFFEWLYLRSGDQAWLAVTKFWTRVFGLTFALGVATGIPLVFAFGTNWARYSYFIGDVLGSTLAAEGLFAFTMEAGFLGIMLFGWNRVSKRMHFVSSILVSCGAHFSAIWIVCTNSWMQTPAGYAILKDVKGSEYAVVTNWLDMVLNHSSLSHITHVILGAWMTGAFLIISVGSYYILKQKFQDFAERSLKVGIAIALFCVLAQLLSADHLARIIAKYNPIKLAAFEGVFKTEEYSKIYAFGWVDTEEEKVYGLGIPGVLSFLVHRDFKTPVTGLENVAQSERPLVNAVFQVYHMMILMWALMAVAAVLGVWMWYKNSWKLHPLLLKFLVISVLFPQIANMSGWYATEMGRQPWTVHQLLRTKDAYSGNVTATDAAISLAIFVVIYITFLVLFLVLLDRKIKHGPTEAYEEAPYRDPYKLR